MLNLRWEPLRLEDILRVGCRSMQDDAAERMDDVLASWADTRYGSGQRCRGVLADCVGAVFGCIDDLDGRPRAQSPVMPPDTALHDPATASEALRALRALYEPVVALDGRHVQPFDIVVVGPAGAGPSHVMLVGTAPGHLWHCTPGAGFHRGGWALGSGYEVLHGAFRIGDRWRWLR
jgi:hypothetical protein